MVQSLIRTDLDSALAESKRCVSFKEERISFCSGKGSPEEWKSKKCGEYLWDIDLGYWYLATAQLYAMKNDLASADANIASARLFADRWAGWYSSGLIADWPGMVAQTEGYVSELRGDLAKARKYDQSTPRGIGRLALLALKNKDYHEAFRQAQVAAALKDPAGYNALAGVAEHDGDDAEALKYYYEVLDLTKPEQNQHNFWPLYFAERRTAQRGINRLADKVKLKQR